MRQVQLVSKKYWHAIHSFIYTFNVLVDVLVDQRDPPQPWTLYLACSPSFARKSKRSQRIASASTFYQVFFSFSPFLLLCLFLLFFLHFLTKQIKVRAFFTKKTNTFLTALLLLKVRAKYICLLYCQFKIVTFQFLKNISSYWLALQLK